ncbi:MAG: hypothetical protein JWN85_1665 [Gammaproteobacteria bacterium]|nr:hypothetical protein [Gammaproteobacteria bacterium]
MPYLDISPMINALRTTPDEFEVVDGWLTHTRSSHSFRFDLNDGVELQAACNCTLLAIRPEQRRELAKCFREWESSNWRSLQINREFASHFSRKPGLREMLIVLTGRLHHWLLRPQRFRGAAGAVIHRGVS